MKFTRLRLSGFKSFVEPTELYIEPGLTGVIGPNGCGKSNLLEAMRWVMGENRPTSMRGSGMDDVIFSGTNARPMRNNAEVTLIIDNSDRTAPAPYNDSETIEISRRIEREAGSVYRINGRDVRQRDVHIFFADASTGSTSPALVRQGQISILINQKPLSRRAILEEAAGISGLHQRRHEAELRLKAAETNMSRLDDVIAEIEQQFQGLKRQARQASRYRNLSGLIHRAEAVAFLLRWRTAEAQAKEASDHLNSAAALVGERTEQAAIASTAQAEAANALPPLRDTETAKTAALQRLLHERTALDNEETRAREDAQRLRQRMAQAEADAEREKSREEDAGAALGKVESEAQELNVAQTGAQAMLAEAEEKSLLAEETLTQREAALERLTAELADLNAKRASYERDREEAAALLARADAQLAELKTRLDAAESEAAQAPDVRAAESAVESIRREVAEARANADKAHATHQEAAKRESDARVPLENAERETQRLAAQAEALARLLRPAQDLWPPLIDALKVQPGYEAALAASLGDDLDAPLDEAAPHHWRDLGSLEGAPALPEGVVPLSQFVQAPKVLARRLAFTGVVDPSAGAALQKNLRAGQRLVSQRGDLWRWDGFSMSADAQSPAALRLEQRNRLAVLEGELETAKAARGKVHAVYSGAQTSAAEAFETARQADAHLREREASLIAAQDFAAQAVRAAAERVQRLSELQAEQRSVSDARAAARKSEEDANAALASLPDGVALASQLANAKSLAMDARNEASSARASVESMRREALARGERLAVIGQEAQQWSQRKSSASEHIAALQTRISEMQRELAVLESVPGQIAAKRNTLLDAIGIAETHLKQAADVRAEAEAHLHVADRAAKEADRLLSEAREERAGASARMEAAGVRLDELKTRIRDELDLAPEELYERAELKEGADLPDLGQAEEKVERLKREREQLGGVNLRAEEEAQELETRLNTLQNDRNDLVGAIERLRKGIQSLNREGRERLLAAFDKVNANFERLFKELFQGGEARLTFTESEDPLEAGLEILAKPPGKKLTTLSLLSGGEQALTAISLIFAVFLVNPAPICVLDEVDAPLDDANVDRFCRLLEEMTKMSDTRFLIISHHALTMSRMDRLFGVTMAERGVSQLVSVSLAEAERVVAAE